MAPGMACPRGETGRRLPRALPPADRRHSVVWASANPGRHVCRRSGASIVSGGRRDAPRRRTAYRRRGAGRPSAIPTVAPGIRIGCCWIISAPSSRLAPAWRQRPVFRSMLTGIGDSFQHKRNTTKQTWKMCVRFNTYIAMSYFDIFQNSKKLFQNNQDKSNIVSPSPGWLAQDQAPSGPAGIRFRRHGMPAGTKGTLRPRRALLLAGCSVLLPAAGRREPRNRPQTVRSCAGHARCRSRLPPRRAAYCSA